MGKSVFRFDGFTSTMDKTFFLLTFQQLVLWSWSLWKHALPLLLTTNDPDWCWSLKELHETLCDKRFSPRCCCYRKPVKKHQKRAVMPSASCFKALLIAFHGVPTKDTPLPLYIRLWMDSCQKLFSVGIVCYFNIVLFSSKDNRTTMDMLQTFSYTNQSSITNEISHVITKTWTRAEFSDKITSLGVDVQKLFKIPMKLADYKVQSTSCTPTLYSTPELQLILFLYFVDHACWPYNTY